MQFVQLKRREFITLLGGSVMWPLTARAQHPSGMRRIGMLMGIAESDAGGQAWVQAFRVGIRERGWTEGDNVRVDYRWAAGVAERFQTAAAELVALKPDVILADTTPAVAALKRETLTTPFVFVRVHDPIGSGFVQSLARPGANITGFTNYEFSLGGKWLELLKEIAPSVTRVALLFNPVTAPYAATYLSTLEPAALSHRMVLSNMTVQTADEMDRAIDAFAGESNRGLLVLPDNFLFTHRDRIVALAARRRLPAVYFHESFVRSGGLISYGYNVFDMFRGAASYVDRILRGARPPDLPVQAPTKWDLIVNLQTAKALDLKVPPTLLATADEVIE
jgi:putative tryptophan/tyrosine transport system substrate-binding protein